MYKYEFWVALAAMLGVKGLKWGSLWPSGRVREEKRWQWHTNANPIHVKYTKYREKVPK